MSDAPGPLLPRKKPRQQRAERTVEWILEGAARVFRREGMSATTNRIAREAGVGLGTLYEYFPNKRALLVAIAERHVALAEREIDAALTADEADDEAFLRSLQLAIGNSHRYPSAAVSLVSGTPSVGDTLDVRVRALRVRVLRALEARARARGLPRPALAARVVFGAIGELGSQISYETASPAEHEEISGALLEMALAYLQRPR